MAEIDLAKYNIHTDLIIEKENLTEEELVDGISVTKTENNGLYYTITFNDITDSDNYEKVLKVLITNLKDILKKNNITDNDSCLIIGLGNRLSTPDSLGPLVTDKLVITRHLYLLNKVSPGYRMTSSITPGVMSATGIESADIIKAVIKKIKPSFVIAVDALSAGSIERIVKTIQITDTGIHPGSGIGNNRTEISNKTVSVPVIAIGIPTVTSSSTIVLNTIEYLTKHIAYLKNNEEVNRLTYLNRNYLSKLKDNELSTEERINLLGLIGSLNNNETNNLINEVLNKTSLNSIVTPTEIDFLINKLSLLISSAINNTLHNI